MYFIDIFRNMPIREYTNEEILALLRAEPEKSSIHREAKPKRKISWDRDPPPLRTEEARELAMRKMIRDKQIMPALPFRTFKGFMKQYFRGDKSAKNTRVWYAWGIYVKMEQERLSGVSLEADCIEENAAIKASPSVNDLKSLLDEGNDLLLLNNDIA